MLAGFGDAETVERKLPAAARHRTARKYLDIPIESGDLVVSDPVSGVSAKLHRDLPAHEAVIRPEARARRDVVLVDLVDIKLHTGDRLRRIEEALIHVIGEEPAAGL